MYVLRRRSRIGFEVKSRRQTLALLRSATRLSQFFALLIVPNTGLDQPAKRGRGSPHNTPIVNSPALRPGSERRACSRIARRQTRSMAHEPSNRLLTATEFQQIAAVPAGIAWFANVRQRLPTFANIEDKRTRSAYQIDIKDFMASSESGSRKCRSDSVRSSSTAHRAGQNCNGYYWSVPSHRTPGHHRRQRRSRRRGRDNNGAFQIAVTLAHIETAPTAQSDAVSFLRARRIGPELQPGTRCPASPSTARRMTSPRTHPHRYCG